MSLDLSFLLGLSFSLRLPFLTSMADHRCIQHISLVVMVVVVMEVMATVVEVIQDRTMLTILTSTYKSLQISN